MTATSTWKEEDWSNESSDFNFPLKERGFKPIFSGTKIDNHPFLT
ncbi:hypothetical protein QUB60_03430 [Microcoleus sp. A2-C5]